MNQKGFTFIGILALVATLSISLSLAGPIWSHQLKRERERELLEVGKLYADALYSYAKVSPGIKREYPKELNDLLLDQRIAGMNRHIRKLYVDPTSPQTPWGLIRNHDGGIMGVYSQNPDRPIAEGPIDLDTVKLAPAKTYADWHFKSKLFP